VSRPPILAEAVKDGLNGESFSQGFTAIRAYRPVFTLKEMRTLRVTVITPSVEQTVISRVGSADTISVDILIQKKITSTSNTNVDTMVDLVEEISAYLRGTNFPFSGTINFQWVSSKIDPICDFDDLMHYNVFTSLIHVEYYIAWRK